MEHPVANSARTGLAIILVSLVGSAAWAQTVETIVVASKPVMTIGYVGEFGSVMVRATKIEQQIVQAISVENVGKPRMSVKPSGSGFVICIGGTQLTKVYPQDAKRSGMTVKALAQQWCANFARQFPLAEPSTHMSGSNAGSELARDQARAAAAANVKVPTDQWAITQVTMDELEAYRKLDAATAADQQRLAAVRMYRHYLQWRANAAAGQRPVPAHAPGKCPQPAGCPACKSAKLAVIDGELPIIQLASEQNEPQASPRDAEPAAPDSAPQAVLAGDPCAAVTAIPDPGKTLDQPKTEEQQIAEAWAAIPISAQRRIDSALRVSRLFDGARWSRDRVMICSTLTKALAVAN
jgi:hypothetical protein